MLLKLTISAQSTYHFPLINNLSAIEDQSISLDPISNESNQSGLLDNRTLPVTTCSQSTEVAGYYFYDNAGLQFHNGGFIGCEYSIEMAFNIDELIVRDTRSTDWVSLLSFSHENDHGVYIYIREDNEGFGTLSFWPNGLVGTPDFFNTQDFYLMTLVRNCSGLVRIFINGELFDSYDDSSNAEYIPRSSNDSVVFFRDYPNTVLNDEASPGFVESIILSNTEWSDEEIQDRWTSFCDRMSIIEVTASNFCFGDVTEFSLSPTTSTKDSLSWDFGDTNSGQTNVASGSDVSHTFSEPGVYQVSTNIYYNGIVDPQITEITILEIPEIDLGDDITLEDGDTYTVNLNSQYDYSWGDNETGASRTISEAGTYIVTATNAAGCATIDSISVSMSTAERTFSNLVIPNTITPNGDLINDIWFIENIEEYPSNQILIFDRYGNELLKLVSYTNDWQGDVKGSPLPRGTYFYKLEAGEGIPVKTGFVTIVRP